MGDRNYFLVKKKKLKIMEASILLEQFINLIIVECYLEKSYDRYDIWVYLLFYCFHFCVWHSNLKVLNDRNSKSVICQPQGGGPSGEGLCLGGMLPTRSKV